MSTLKLADILLVEDNEGDIELTKEAFEEAKAEGFADEIPNRSERLQIAK